MISGGSFDGFIQSWRARRRWLGWLILVLVAVGIWLRVRWNPVAAEAYGVVADSIVQEVPGTGTLEARLRVTLSARIQERLAEVLVDQGDTVRAGQILARLDDGELRQQVELAAASLAAARATAERVAVDEGRARAVEEQARTDLQRIGDLVQKKVSSESDLDKATERMRIAEADVRRARASTSEAQQQARVAEATLAFHQERLGFTRIVSPLDGLVVRRDRDPGGIVVPGGSILQIVATNELWVSAWIDETAAGALRTGQAATMVFRSDGTNEVSGRVIRLGRETDRETREFLVDIAPERLPSNWTIGQRADVFIRTVATPTNALAVPERFLRWEEGQAGIHVLVGSRAEWRPVTLGMRGRDRVEIRSGVSAGEQVLVARPGSTLRNGSRVVLP